MLAILNSISCHPALSIFSSNPNERGKISRIASSRPIRQLFPLLSQIHYWPMKTHLFFDSCHSHSMLSTHTITISATIWWHHNHVNTHLSISGLFLLFSSLFFMLLKKGFWWPSFWWFSIIWVLNMGSLVSSSILSSVPGLRAPCLDRSQNCLGSQPKPKKVKVL